MVKLTCQIQIGDFVFRGINMLTIESSWENKTDTCNIIIPRHIAWEGKELVYGSSPILTKGDMVVIKAGYDNNNTTIYQGYIVDISAKIPTEIKCEDDFFLLKKGSISKTYKNVLLSKLIADIMPQGIKYKIVADRQIGNIRIIDATPAKIIAYLHENYLIKSFFREGILYIGLAIVSNLQKTHNVSFQKDILEDDLVYKIKEDIKLKLKANIKKNKKPIEVGDSDGEIRTFNYPQNTNETQVKQLLNQELERLKYTGYRGSITCFGSPMMNHGDLVTIDDTNYPERKGTYLIKKVTREFGVQGYRQKIELESKYQ